MSLQHRMRHTTTRSHGHNLSPIYVYCKVVQFQGHNPMTREYMYSKTWYKSAAESLDQNGHIVQSQTTNAPNVIWSYMDILRDTHDERWLAAKTDMERNRILLFQSTNAKLYNDTYTRYKVEELRDKVKEAASFTKVCIIIILYDYYSKIVKIIEIFLYKPRVQRVFTS